MEPQKYIRWRKMLHELPELSGQEKQTAEQIKTILQQLHPTRLYTQPQGNGILAEFCFSDESPVLLFRADIDAVSVEGRAAHQCGHDGHTAILLAFADLLHQYPLQRGRILLLFQPSEENGEGASLVSDLLWKFQIDRAYALHNLPGYPLSTIVCRTGSFTCAVISCTIRIQGQTSHAAEPEKAISPLQPLLALYNVTQSWNAADIHSVDYFRSTLIELHIGEEAYGVTAGNGLLRLTLRAATSKNLNRHMDKLSTSIREMKENRKDLKITIDWMEAFYANKNDDKAVENIRHAAVANQLTYIENQHPFAWGEDFGYITSNYSGAMFGLGAGTQTSPLHTPQYEFPDEIILPGARMFYELAKEEVTKR